MDAEKYDILIVGSGAAGKLMGWAMAQAGHRTAVIERKLIGGSCPNIACLPSKNVVYSAKVVSLARRGAEFGLDLSGMNVNMAAVERRKRLMVEGLVQMHLDRYKASGCELIMGHARFADAHTVDVNFNDGGQRRFNGERVFVDVGSRTAITNVPGLAESKPLTHIEALELERLPEHLIVLGGGYVGLEFAQAMRRFGAQVTVIERGPHLAGREDPDVAAAIEQLFRDEGIQVLVNTEVTKAEGTSGQQVRLGIKANAGQSAVDGSDILVATGRVPNTGGIGLEEAGIELNEHGYVKVNDRLETTAPNVWAMGDCAGSPQFTHVAEDDFRIVHENLNGGSRTVRDRIVPFCMFTDPELARVGLNETEAHNRGIAYRAAQMPMANILRTRTISEPRGFLKILIAANSDEILGFSAFGTEASELMASVQTAMVGRVPFTVLRKAIFTHPTMSEGITGLLEQITPYNG